MILWVCVWGGSGWLGCAGVCKQTSHHVSCLHHVNPPLSSSCSPLRSHGAPKTRVWTEGRNIRTTPACSWEKGIMGGACIWTTKRVKGKKWECVTTCPRSTYREYVSKSHFIASSFAFLDENKGVSITRCLPVRNTLLPVINRRTVSFFVCVEMWHIKQILAN